MISVENRTCKCIQIFGEVSWAPALWKNFNEIRGNFKYYFADFVRMGGTPPPLRTKFSPKKSYGFVIFLLKKHLFLVQKLGYGYGGYPSPPFTDKIFDKKGVTDLGGTPPPRGKVMSQGANKLQRPFLANSIYSRHPISKMPINSCENRINSCKH